jgi:hypothetical protein
VRRLPFFTSSIGVDFHDLRHIFCQGFKYHTYLDPIFSALNGHQNDYNWLIADFVCYPKGTAANAVLGISPCGTTCPDYRFLSGEELTKLIHTEHIQWIWGVFCAFEKHISLDEILAHPLPCSESYAALYQLPVSMQHPLSQIEIYAQYSSATVFLSRSEEPTALLRSTFPKSQHLSDYIVSSKKRNFRIPHIFR